MVLNVNGLHLIQFNLIFNISIHFQKIDTFTLNEIK